MWTSVTIPSYVTPPFKDIKITHVPESSPSPTPVLIIDFNRPTRHNAVTENLLDELEAAYDLANRDERVRAIVLTGSGQSFCSGADLQAMDEYRDQEAIPISGGRLALAMTNCTKPTIVALNGPAAGFGATITLPATIRVAWSGAKIAFPFSRRGLTLESCSAFFLPRILGLAKAMHLATTGSAYAASDPLVSGLFSRLLPTPQETVAYAVELATDVADNTSLTSTKLMRDMLLHTPATLEETHRLDSKLSFPCSDPKITWQAFKR
ncbi:hypothetical protein BN1723_011224 [Verticillium longisporum]|uniref:Enoyl-CoA hydratase n=1 Tax=Verticillium longisporum TaxID=100787 RepID=A0A0G4L553_VERLO|nr:hypothetical protein BN1723_011224 [Verticillium longisporum]